MGYTGSTRSFSGWRRGGAAATVALVLGLLAGCGAAHSKSGSGALSAYVRVACSPRTVAVLARDSSQPRASIRAAAFIAPSGSEGCRYRAPGARGPDVTVELDAAAQAYYRLDREVVEYSQNVIWAHQSPKVYPQYIPRLGIEADWLPSPQELVSTDGLRVVSVSMSRWIARAGAAELAAEDVARLYLKAGRAAVG